MKEAFEGIFARYSSVQSDSESFRLTDDVRKWTSVKDIVELGKLAEDELDDGADLTSEDDGSLVIESDSEDDELTK